LLEAFTKPDELAEVLHASGVDGQLGKIGEEVVDEVGF